MTVQAAPVLPQPPHVEHRPDSAPRQSSVWWFVLCAALLLVGGSAAQKTYRWTLPTDGWTFNYGNIGSSDQDHPIYAHNLFGKPSPLHPGDALIAMDGQLYASLLARQPRLNPPALPGWRSGAVVHYTVRRNGTLVTLAVPLYTWTFGGALLALLTDVSLLATLLLFGLGLFVFFRRPDVWAARPLLLFSASLLASRISSSTIDWGPPELASPLFLPFWEFFSNFIFAMALLPSLLMTTLTFPSPKAFVRRHALPVVLLLYGTSPALLLVFGPQAPAFWLATLVMAALSAGIVIVSVLRERDPVARAQARWAVLGLATMAFGVVTLVLGAFGLLGSWPAWLETLWFSFMLAAVPVGFSIAILRYRLFDIDLVINRILVYGGLSLSVIGLYVGVVAYCRDLLHLQNSAVPSLIVTALVAVTFQPGRAWLQGRVNHLMYGDRDTPYLALARLGERFEDAFDPLDVMPALVSTVAHSLRLPYAAIRVAGEPLADGGAVVGTPTGDITSFPLVHQGEQVGTLVVSPRRGEPALSDADRRLLTHLAQRAGVAVHGVRLTMHLERLSADLQRSRERLVLAREEERSRLRRDLHDGLAPTLAGLSLTAGTIKGLVRRDPEEATALAAELEGAIRDTVGEVRRVVYNLRPPTLDELGLLAAIRELVAQFGSDGRATNRMDVAALLPDGLPPLPAAVEVAVYRIVQEGLMNAERHAHARLCSISLHVGDDLCLEIMDDGLGLVDRYEPGVGLRSMRERTEELGGVFQIATSTGEGTRIMARFPLTAR